MRCMVIVHDGMVHDVMVCVDKVRLLQLVLLLVVLGHSVEQLHTYGFRFFC